MQLRYLNAQHMKICYLVTLFLISVFTTYSQNLIGYDAKDIKKYMSANNSDMNLEKVINKSFRYLKYSDSYDNQTMLFFLSPDSVCTNIRIVCNKSIKSKKIRELDAACQRSGENIWRDDSNIEGRAYLFKLIDEDWSFSIIIEPEK